MAFLVAWRVSRRERRSGPRMGADEATHVAHRDVPFDGRRHPRARRDRLELARRGDLDSRLDAARHRPMRTLVLEVLAARVHDGTVVVAHRVLRGCPPLSTSSTRVTSTRLGTRTDALARSSKKAKTSAQGAAISTCSRTRPPLTAALATPANRAGRAGSVRARSPARRRSAGARPTMCLTRRLRRSALRAW